MLFFVRTARGLGNATIYARLKNTSGQFWDFVALGWTAIEGVNNRVYLAEFPDGDPLESLYMAEAEIPPGGPWIEDAVDITDGSVIAFDNNVMGELESLPDEGSSLQEKISYIFQYLAGKRTATSTLETMLKTDGTVLGTAILTDDGNTFIKNKIQ